MEGVLSGFAIIATVIAAGYVAGRVGLITPESSPAIARLVFFVLAPCLLFTVIAAAPVRQLASPLLLVSMLAALIVFLVFALVARFVWRRSVSDIALGALSSGYVNSNNIGLPVAAYVLGNPAYVAPLILGQLLILTPVFLLVLDASTGDSLSIGKVLLGPVRNPILIGSALGAVVAATGVAVPDAVMEPFRIIGGATVPLMLMNFGASMVGLRVLRPGPQRKDVLLASSLKLLAMPAAAWLLGDLVFGLRGHDLFVVVTLAGLPTAQNVFNYAQRYGTGELVVRDTILITTIGALPVLLAVAALMS